MNTYDIIIIGGGPAALTAGLYASRLGKKVCLLEKNMEGGRIIETPVVDNIPGCPHILGGTFAEILSQQAREFGVEVFYEEVVNVCYDRENRLCKITTDEGEYSSTATILSTGTKPRTLNLNGESLLIGNGISFCALCDGAFYKGKDVIVVGGGNSAITEAISLSNICKSVKVIQNLEYLTADKTLIDQLNKQENVHVLCNSIVTGYNVQDGKLIGVYVEDNEGTRSETVSADGVFLSIGMVPNTQIFNNFVDLDDFGYIKADIKNKTSIPGVYACGDCRSGTYKQVVIACGDGASAAIEACKYVDDLKNNK